MIPLSLGTIAQIVGAQIVGAQIVGAELTGAQLAGALAEHGGRDADRVWLSPAPPGPGPASRPERAIGEDA